MMSTATVNDVADGLAQESVPSLEDFAEEAGGAWPAGWYGAKVIEGYSTPKGKVFTTADAPSSNGDSRNLRLCFSVKGPGGERTMQETFNYRPSDFTPERLAFIKEAREENKNVKGRWANVDAQRSSLAVAKIGAIEKALGTTIRTSAGTIAADKATNSSVDVRLSTNEDGYNVVTKFAAPGTKAKS
jgi:hypothetical protein